MLAAALEDTQILTYPGSRRRQAMLNKDNLEMGIGNEGQNQEISEITNTLIYRKKKALGLITVMRDQVNTVR